MLNLKRYIYSLVFLLALIFVEISSANFIVQTIYFQPTDAPNIDNVRNNIQKLMLETQELYGNELDRQGFGKKTFDLEKDNNGLVLVHHVVAKNNSNHYVNNTWNNVLPELPDQFNPNTAPWNKQDRIRVIVIGGVQLVDGRWWGIGWPVHSNRYGGTTYMAGGTPHFDKNLIFHEIGHCFGLYHKEIVVEGQLDHYEVRWLSEHYHFNGDQNNFTFPTPINKNPLLTNQDDNMVRFELELTSDIGLHQAQIHRTSDIIVLDWDYLNGKGKDTATFEVNRNKWGNKVTLQIMDTRGNYHATHITIVLPKKPEIKDPEAIDEPEDKTPKPVNPRSKVTTSWAQIKARR